MVALVCLLIGGGLGVWCVRSALHMEREKNRLLEEVLDAFVAKLKEQCNGG